MPYYRRRTYGSRMPYRRRGTFRRRGTSRRTGVTYGQIGAKVYKDVQMLKNLINTEFKEQNQAVTSSPSTTGTVTHLNSIAIGDSESTRDGAQVREKSISVTGHTKLHASATDTQVRMVVFIWTNVQGVAPVVSDILKDGDVDSQINTDNKHNYVILKDWNYTLSTQVPRRVFKWYRRIDLKTQWQRGQTGGGSSVMEHGGLYCITISTEATNTPGQNLNFRIKYIDN